MGGRVFGWCLPREVSAHWEVSAQEGVCPGGVCSGDVCPGGHLPRRGCLLSGMSGHRGCLAMGGVCPGCIVCLVCPGVSA